MRLVGVVAEYDPFHAGHAHHLREAKRLTGADAAVVIMSTAFTQRGQAALLFPDDRARMALACGADVVIALPALWALRDAEHFALGGVHLLSALGCDAIAFGAEEADLTRLQAAAALIEQPDSATQAALHRHLSSGLSYPAALAAACGDVLPGADELLSKPNNTLALCYLRALVRLSSSMTPCAVPRVSDYHATSLGTALPSATAVRGAILRGDWHGTEASMPSEAFSILREAVAAGRLLRPEALDQALLYRLRTMTSEDWKALPGLSEGIEDRLQKAARTARSREQLLDSAKTRRYPRARLARLCAHALLGFTQDMLDQTPLPQEAWLLGFGPDTQEVLRRLGQGRIPLLSRSAEVLNAPWAPPELRAWDAWCLGAGQPAGLALARRTLTPDR